MVKYLGAKRIQGSSIGGVGLWGTVKNMVVTEDSAVKTLTTDSYTDNQAVSASSQTSGTAYVSFTPTSVTAEHIYICGLHKDNDVTNETWGGTNMSYSWQGAGVTGKGYCVKGNPSTGSSSIIHTVSSGITTSSILKVEYNFSTNTVKWYKDGSELASTTGDNDSALFATFFTKKGGSVATPVGADNILTSIAETGNTYEDEKAELAVGGTLIGSTTPVYDTHWASAGNNVYRCAFDSSGNLWVVNADDDRVYKYSATGTLLQTVGTGSNSSSNGDFNYPLGIAIDSSDNIWVTEYQNHRIQKFNNSGVYQSKFALGGSSEATGLAIDSSGYLYVANMGENKLEKFNTSGTSQGSVSITGCWSVAINSDDEIFVMRYGGGAVVTKYNTSLVSQGTVTIPNGVEDGLGQIMFDSDDNWYIGYEATTGNVRTLLKYNSSDVLQWTYDVGTNKGASGTINTALITGGAVSNDDQFVYYAYRLSGASTWYIERVAVKEYIPKILTNTIFEESDARKYRWWNGSEWKIDGTEQNNLYRGLFMGGYDGSSGTNSIEYITIPNLGNSTDFGDLTETKWGCSAGTNGSRAVRFCGQSGSASTASNVIDYVTIATPSNATDFGDLSAGARGWQGSSAMNNNTRSVIATGLNSSNAYINNMDYITIATTSNATDFGNFLYTAYGTGCCDDKTRGVMVGGRNSSGTFMTDISYITISTTGHATNSNYDMGYGSHNRQGTADDTRGVFFGGYNGSSNVNNIEYFTIQSLANATDFGDMSATGDSTLNVADNTRAVIASTDLTNDMEYITIQTTGNSANYGDMITKRDTGGGTQGY